MRSISPGGEPCRPAPGKPAGPSDSFLYSLHCTTCLTHGFFKSGEQCSEYNKLWFIYNRDGNMNNYVFFFFFFVKTNKHMT